MSKRVKLGLLGNNLGRSRAKDLHEFLGEIHGLAVTYQPMDLLDRSGPVSIVDELRRCQAEGYCGVNVTHPYKKEAFGCVTTLAGFPEGLTSVNTVLFTEQGMQADNTDYSGCCRGFRSRFGAGFQPGRVLMLGVGGVGVAIAYAMQTLGAMELVVHDANELLTREFVAQMAGSRLPVRAAGPDLVAEMQRADGLINATPVGMFQYPGNPFPLAGFGSQRWGFDAVYTPENTEFLSRCRQLDIEALSGFYLFWYQGLDAFCRFTGIVVDQERIRGQFLKRYPLE
ncbi:MAG: shikimate dehydrogenase family protein [Desulfopila sp.]